MLLANTARAIMTMFPEASRVDVSVEASVGRDSTEDIAYSAHLTRPSIGPVTITADTVEKLLAKSLATSLRAQLARPGNGLMGLLHSN